MLISKVLLGLSPFFALVPLSVFLLKHRGFSRSLRWIGGYIILCTITGFLSLVLWYIKANNLWVLPIQTTLELPLLYFALYTELRNPNTRFIVFTIVLLFVCFSIVNSVWLQSLLSYNSYSQTFGSLLIIGYCVYYFIDLIRKMNVKNLYDEPMFWITGSILFYYASTLFIYGLGNILIHHSKSLNRWIWLFHVLLAALHYTFISIGFWRKKTI
jgi:hypothetical protein